MNILSKCILLFTSGTELYILLGFLESFFEYRKYFQERKWRIILVFIVMLVLNNGVYLFENTVLNIIWNPISYFAVTAILFEGSNISKMLYVIVSYLVFAFCEFIYAVITGDFSDGSTKQKNLVQVSPWQLISMQLLKYIVFLVIKQFAGKKDRKLDKKWIGVYVLILISNLMFMLIIIYSGIDFAGKLYAQIAVSICFGISLVGNILLFYLFHKYSETLYSETQKELYIQQQKASVRHYEMLEEANHRYAEFQHDINHYLQAIGELAADGEDERITGILQELQIQMSHNVQMVYSRHPVVNAVLAEKAEECKKGNIAITINVEPLADTERLADADWIGILGNLLDNAIRAAGGCREGSIRIHIFMEKDDEYLVIKIGNTYEGQIVREHHRLISTKKYPQGHGIGFRNVQKIVQKYEGMLNQTEENQYFEVIILIPKL